MTAKALRGGIQNVSADRMPAMCHCQKLNPGREADLQLT